MLKHIIYNFFHILIFLSVILFFNCEKKDIVSVTNIKENKIALDKDYKFYVVAYGIANKKSLESSFGAQGMAQTAAKIVAQKNLLFLNGCKFEKSNNEWSYLNKGNVILPDLGYKYYSDFYCKAVGEVNNIKLTNSFITRLDFTVKYNGKLKLNDYDSVVTYHKIISDTINLTLLKYFENKFQINEYIQFKYFNVIKNIGSKKIPVTVDYIIDNYK